MTKILTWFLCFFITMSCLANDSSTTANIVIMCSTSTSYCQGKSPENDELKISETPEYIQMNVFLYAVDSLAAQKIIPVICGKSIEIETGKYIISTSPNLSYPKIDDCRLPKMVRTNDEANMRLIEVTAETDQVFQYNYHHYCAWQLNYNIAIPNGAGW